jgi:hypothetical protein
VENQNDGKIFPKLPSAKLLEKLLPKKGQIQIRLKKCKDGKFAQSQNLNDLGSNAELR